MEISNIVQWKIDGQEVIQVVVNNQIFWKKQEQPPVECKAFYIENISDKENEIVLTCMLDEPNCTFDYKLDDGEWQLWGSTFDPMTSELLPRFKEGINIKLQPHQKIYLRGDNHTLAIDYYGNNTVLFNQYEVNIGGDLTSLISKEANVLDLTGRDYCFYHLFSRAKVKNADNLILPSTILSKYCYGGLFGSATLELNSLESANFVLPAEILTESCYRGMFMVSQITKAPTIKAKEMGLKSMMLMFGDCPNLNEVSIEFTKWNETDAQEWLKGVASSGNIVAPNLSVADFPIGASGVPEGWTVNNEKPVIPIEPFYIQDASGAENSLTITQTGSVPIKLEYSNDNKVWQEWVNCQSTALPITANSKVYLRGNNNVFGVDFQNYNTFYCGGNFNIGGDLTTLLDPNGNVLDLTGRNYIFTMLFNTTKVVDASKLILPSTILADYCYKGMFQDCLSLVTAPELPATTLAPYCYFGMFNGCASLTTTPTLPATTLVLYCYFGMFKSCTSLVNAPELPATTLVGNCYIEMFRYCKSLIKIEIGATTWNKNFAKNWLQGVAQVGTFIKPKELTNIPNGTYGIPLEWEVINK